MTNGVEAGTHAAEANQDNGTIPPQPGRGSPALWGTIVFIGVAAASAGLAYAIVRTKLERPPADPTTERIRALIDEANRLLRQLDDQKHG